MSEGEGCGVQAATPAPTLHSCGDTAARWVGGQPPGGDPAQRKCPQQHASSWNQVTEVEEGGFLPILKVSLSWLEVSSVWPSTVVVNRPSSPVPCGVGGHGLGPTLGHRPGSHTEGVYLMQLWLDGAVFWAPFKPGVTSSSGQLGTQHTAHKIREFRDVWERQNVTKILKLRRVCHENTFKILRGALPSFRGCPLPRGRSPVQRKHCGHTLGDSPDHSWATIHDDSASAGNGFPLIPIIPTGTWLPSAIMTSISLFFLRPQRNTFPLWEV